MALDQWGRNTEDPFGRLKYGGWDPTAPENNGAPVSPNLDKNGLPNDKGLPGGGGLPIGGSSTAPAATAPAVVGAGTTGAGILGSSLKWGDIINAALAIHSMKQNSKTPNFYPVPPSPAEQYRLDKTKGLYDFASNYTEQYLKGLGNVNPDFHMPNNLTGNPDFMGGVKAPTFDASKAPSITGAPPAGTNPAASIPPGITPERVRVDPNTGKWVIDGATPEEQAWLDAANAANAAKTGGAPPAP